MSKQAVYTLDEFQAAYSLNSEEAKRVFNISGPARADLDIFMKVYRQRGSAERLFVGCT